MFNILFFLWKYSSKKSFYLKKNQFYQRLKFFKEKTEKKKVFPTTSKFVAILHLQQNVHIENKFSSYIVEISPIFE